MAAVSANVARRKRQVSTATRSASSASRAPIGERDAMIASRCAAQSSALSTVGSTTAREVSPWRVAFRDERAFPARVRGPVLFVAFSRATSARGRVTTGSASAPSRKASGSSTVVSCETKPGAGVHPSREVCSALDALTSTGSVSLRGARAGVSRAPAPLRLILRGAQPLGIIGPGSAIGQQHLRNRAATPPQSGSNTSGQRTCFRGRPVFRGAPMRSAMAASRDCSGRLAARDW